MNMAVGQSIIVKAYFIILAKEVLYRVALKPAAL